LDSIVSSPLAKNPITNLEEEMEIASVTLKRCTVIRLGGRIDRSAAEDLGIYLRSLTAGGYFNIVINMNEVEYTSSLALRELIHTQKDCMLWNRGKVLLAEVTPNVLKVLELTGLKDQITAGGFSGRIFATEAEAVGSF